MNVPEIGVDSSAIIRSSYDMILIWNISIMWEAWRDLATWGHSSRVHPEANSTLHSTTGGHGLQSLSLQETSRRPATGTTCLAMGWLLFQPVPITFPYHVS